MPPLVRPHKRIRKLKTKAHDFEKRFHTESEHKSHGKKSYLKTHPPPPGIQAAERGR